MEPAVAVSNDTGMAPLEPVLRFIGDAVSGLLLARLTHRRHGESLASDPYRRSTCPRRRTFQALRPQPR